MPASVDSRSSGNVGVVGAASSAAFKRRAAHDGARQRAHREHHRLPDRRRVDHGRAAVDRAHDPARDRLRRARERRRGEPLGHRGVHEARLHGDHAQTLGVVAVVEAFEVAGEPRLGRAVEHHRRAPALARDRREHAERAAPARQQPHAHRLAPLDAMREVGGEQVAAEARVRFERGPAARRAPPERIAVLNPSSARSAASSAASKPAGSSRSQARAADRRARAAHLEVARAARERARVAAEQEQPLAARGQHARDGAAHAARGAEQHRLHGVGSSRRCASALESVRSGSHLRRTSFQRASRGSIAREVVAPRERVLGQVDAAARLDHELVQRVDERLRVAARGRAGRARATSRASGTRACPCLRHRSP